MKIKHHVIKKIALDNDLNRYISAKQSTIPPLFIMTDGLRTCTFGKEQTRYIQIEDAIKWFEKEKRLETEKERVEVYESNIKFLKKCLTQELTPEIQKIKEEGSHEIII